MKGRWIAVLSVTGVIGMAALLSVAEEGYGYEGEGLAALAGQENVRPVKNDIYAAECGSCHFAYPPGLLPERSWRNVMARLDDHFGENAELSPGLQQQLTDYLVGNAAESDPGRVSRAVLRSVAPDAAPLRITELRYFVREHNEIPARLWRDNPEVGSLSNCDACHRKADTGSFREHQVNIPGVGRWDD